VAVNKMTSATLNNLLDSQLPATGNTLDIVAIIKTDDINYTPTLENIVINYDANILNQGAVLGVDYNYDQPSTTEVRVKSLANNNLKMRVI